MDDSLKYFLENTRVTASAMESRLTHPITRLRYPRRLVYDRLEKYANDFLMSGSEPRFVSLAGLRGVGKTTLLWQAAHYIYTHHHKAVYFFNVNTLTNLGISLQLALEEFQRHILQKRFHELSAPITLLFDEVHDDPYWSKTLKILYDEAGTAFILCTGSSALLLNSTADLSRRMYIQKVYPFSFSELLHTQKEMHPEAGIMSPDLTLEAQLKDLLFFSANEVALMSGLTRLSPAIQAVISQKNLVIDQLQEQYINFLNFPNFLFFKDEIIITHSILDLFKRIIHEDIQKLQPAFSDVMKIERLLLRLAGSDEINPEKLAGILGVKQKDIHELMDILSKAELLNVLHPYGGLDTKLIKNKKAFFMSPSLRRALLTTLYGQILPETFKSKLIEDIVVMYLKRVLTDGVISFVSGSNEANPDFVIETRDKPILLEIGTIKTSTKQLRQPGLPYRYGLLVSNGVTEPILKGDCVHLPLGWFLLL
jgi:predicted AAA+ superfamily ATPase